MQPVYTERKSLGGELVLSLLPLGVIAALTLVILILVTHSSCSPR